MTPDKAFGQYLDLFRTSPVNNTGMLAAFNNECAEKLPDAIAQYKPDATDLRTTRADELFAPDYGVNTRHIDMAADPAASFRCGVPQLNSLLAVVANDVFHPTSSLANTPEGLTVASLRNLDGYLAEDVLDIMHRLSRDSVPELINGMLLHDGVYICAGRNAAVEKPVQIVNIFNSTLPLLTPRRVVLHAMEGAHIRVLLCDHSQTPHTPHLNSQVVQIYAEAGARVELYDIEETSSATRRYATVAAHLADGASLVLNNTFLQGGISRNDYYVSLLGNHADANLSGLGILAAGQALDNKVLLAHVGTSGTSRQLFKNALFDNALGGFGGKIIVLPGAARTDAAQTNRNILASPEARMQAAPQLEIYCDDVKCSHGATTGQLDERALFYMQTRGIPYEEARRMLTQAFMADVVDNISFEVLRQRIHILVEKRLNGTAGNCDTCAGCYNKNDEEL